MLFKLLNSLLLLPLKATSDYMARRMSFSFSIAFSTSIAGFFIATYIAVFLSTTLNFSSPHALERFIQLFIIFCLFFYALGYYTHFGLFSHFGIKPFNKKLQLVNESYKNNELHHPQDDESARKLLEALERMPIENVRAALFYPTVVMIAVVVQEVIIGATYNAIMMAIGISSAIFIYVFTTYIVAELLTGEKRVELKRFMVQKGYSFQEKFLFSIRRKFMFITFLVLIAMSELGLMFYFSTTRGHVVMPVLFIIFTSILIGSLLFLYQLSIQNSLSDIEKAAIDLGKGGAGKLFLGGLDRELINVGRGFVTAAYEVNDIRNNLEDRVQERTEELNDIIEKMKKLQEQQSGDYFLTSLLIEPIAVNKASGVNVHVDFFLKQKKEFSFRNWQKAIGGDICIAHNFFLRGKLFTVFMNADAMGKSMQGAGGALVLGSGFQAIIDRTRFSSMEQDQSPEMWVRKAHYELQRLFESFNGSMLMSVMMGLVEDDTGMVYYVNAEHPWTVLYRNGKAEFIEKELLLWKLGVEQDLSKVKVRTFRMEPGDVLVAGSDGRDDILLDNQQEGPNIMNEDERLFLKNVEKGEGDLEKIADILQATGELTDDLSLLKIHYVDSPIRLIKDAEDGVEDIRKKAIALNKDGKKEEALALLEEGLASYKHHPALLKQMVKYSVALRDYKRAIPYVEEFIEQHPEETEYIHIASYCLRKTGRVNEAIQLSMRTHYREPDNTRYALHLAQLYIARKDYIDADKLLDIILSNDPDNSKALELKNAM